jgi:hypothetical protein
MATLTHKESVIEQHRASLGDPAVSPAQKEHAQAQIEELQRQLAELQRQSAVADARPAESQPQPHPQSY